MDILKGLAAGRRYRVFHLFVWCWRSCSTVSPAGLGLVQATQVWVQKGNGTGTDYIHRCKKPISEIVDLGLQAISELRGLLGEEAISTDDEDLHLHGYSEWSTVNVDELPVAVAYPKSTEEVSQIAKVCCKYRVPMSK